MLLMIKSPLNWGRHMPRTRHQNGRVHCTDNKAKWYGEYYVYRVEEDGQERRKHRTVVLGPKASLKKWEAGSIDTIVARPLSRWKIFFAKYVGSLFFMLVQAAFFVVLLFLAVGLRWKAWFPGLLWSIPLLVLLFSYLYCICVAFGLWTRNGMASLLLTLAVWLIPITAIQAGYETTHSLLQMKDWHMVRATTATLRWVVPNTTGIPRMVQKAMDDTDPMEMIEIEAGWDVPMSKEELEYMFEFERQMIAKPWYYWVGPSVLFEAAVLTLAGWRFSRKDF